MNFPIVCSQEVQKRKLHVHEYQCQAIMSRFHISVPRSQPATSVEEAVSGAKKLGSFVVVFKRHRGLFCSISLDEHCICCGSHRYQKQECCNESTDFGWRSWLGIVYVWFARWSARLHVVRSIFFSSGFYCARAVVMLQCVQILCCMMQDPNGQSVCRANDRTSADHETNRPRFVHRMSVRRRDV